MLEEASGSFRIMELWGWKGLVGVILSSPLAQAVSSLQPPAQGCPSWEAAQGFVLWPEHLQGWRLYNLPGQTVHCLIALGVKKVLIGGKKDLKLLFQLMPVVCFALIMHHSEELALAILISWQIQGGCCQVLKQSVLQAEQALTPQPLLLRKVLHVLTIAGLLC